MNFLKKYFSFQPFLILKVSSECVGRERILGGLRHYCQVKWNPFSATAIANAMHDLPAIKEEILPSEKKESICKSICIHSFIEYWNVAFFANKNSWLSKDFINIWIII